MFKPPMCERPSCGHVDTSHHEGVHACLVRGCECSRMRAPGRALSVPPPAPEPPAEDAAPETDPYSFWPMGP